MVYETIKQKYSENKSVKFKLYSLEYMIEEIDNKVVIYAILYPSRKLTYNTLEEAFDNF